MTVESSIFTRLSGYSDLAALVGSRIYPVRAKQGDPVPYVVYTRISTTSVSAMGADRPDESARFQFDCYSDSFDGARAVLGQVKNALKRHQGDGIVDAFELNENDHNEDETELYRSQIDFRIHY